jgi:hypothetical protein
MRSSHKRSSLFQDDEAEAVPTDELIIVDETAPEEANDPTPGANVIKLFCL